MNTTSHQKSFRQQLTDQLVEALEESQQLPWHSGITNLWRPFNPVSGAKYKGGNVVNLLFEQQARGSQDPRWMTLKQANEAGYRVKHGSTAAYVEYWDWSGATKDTIRVIEIDAKRVNQISSELKKVNEGVGLAQPKLSEIAYSYWNQVMTPTDRGQLMEQLRDKFPVSEFNPGQSKAQEEEKLRGKLNVCIKFIETAISEQLKEFKRPKVMHIAVFNGEDIEGLPPLKAPSWDANVLAERLIKSTKANLVHSDTAECGLYVVNEDKIISPSKNSFITDADYYATVGHELGHWTGHPSRLNRITNRLGADPELLAREELRAEIAGMFFNSTFGIQGDVKNHAAYASYWVKFLTESKDEIFRAARDADKMVDYLLDYDPELKKQLDENIKINLLPKDGIEKVAPIGNKLSGLPNFVPEGAEKKQGKDDPRWPIFSEIVTDTLIASGMDQKLIDLTISKSEPNFTTLINSALTQINPADNKKHTVESFAALYAGTFIKELSLAKERESQWELFCNQIRHHAIGQYDSSEVERALNSVAEKYQKIVVEEKIGTRDQSDKKIHDLIYGEEGRRKIDSVFVEQFMQSYFDSYQVMSIKQEMVFRHLLGFNIDLNAAKQFVIESPSEILDSVHAEITKLQKLYSELNSSLPEDDVIENHPAYISQSQKIPALFYEFYQINSDARQELENDSLLDEDDYLTPTGINKAEVSDMGIADDEYITGYAESASASYSDMEP